MTPKGLLHISDGADELDGAAFRAGSIERDPEAVLFREGTDELDCGRVCAVPLTVLGVSKTLFAGPISDFEWGVAFDESGRRTSLTCQLIGSINQSSSARSIKIT